MLFCYSSPGKSYKYKWQSSCHTGNIKQRQKKGDLFSSFQVGVVSRKTGCCSRGPWCHCGFSGATGAGEDVGLFEETEIVVCGALTIMLEILEIFVIQESLTGEKAITR